MGSIFAKVIETFAGAPPAYRLSGAVVALFFFVVWRGSNNKQIINLLNRSLNNRLDSTQLLQVIRIILFAGFAFSTLLIILAFISPIIAKRFDAINVQHTAAALAALRASRYEEARRLYRQELATAPDDVDADRIRGMITSTYYGQGLHREGLQYICEIYKGRSPEDHRYIWPIQAHLRRIRIKDGAAAAIETAQHFRRTCGREDFSTYWPFIRLGMMEQLSYGAPSNTRADEDDETTLRKLVGPERETESTQPRPFTDYALYALGEKTKILSDFKSSPLRDTILREMAYAAPWPKNISYFKQLLAEYAPADSADLYGSMAAIYAEHGRTEEALTSAEKMTLATKSEAAQFVSQSASVNFTPLIAEGRWGDALASVERTCETAQAHGVKCPGKTLQTRDRLSKIVKETSTGDRSRCRFVFMEIRDLGFRRGSRAYLDTCLNALRNNRLEYGRALYQAASVSRKLGEYNDPGGYLDRFIQEVPEHPLLDDAYAEKIYQADLAGDYVEVDRLMRLIQQKFEGRNAYDNALYIAAKSARAQGRLARSVNYYFTIASGNWVPRPSWIDQAEHVQRKLQDIPFFNDAAITSTMRFGDIKAGSIAQASGVRPGDTLAAMCTADLSLCRRTKTLVELATVGRNVGGGEVIMLLKRDGVSTAIQGSLTDSGWRNVQVTTTRLDEALRNAR